jgi:hypothetical protein
MKQIHNPHNKFLFFVFVFVFVFVFSVELVWMLSLMNVPFTHSQIHFAHFLLVFLLLVLEPLELFFV